MREALQSIWTAYKNFKVKMDKRHAREERAATTDKAKAGTNAAKRQAQVAVGKEATSSRKVRKATQETMPNEGNAEVQAGLLGHEAAQSEEHTQYVPWSSKSSPTWEEDDDDIMPHRDLVFAEYKLAPQSATRPDNTY